MSDMSEQGKSILAELLAAARSKVPLEIISVVDRGVPNHERVNLRVNSRVFLGEYFIYAGISLPNDRALPLANVSLWLGEDTIDAGSWVVIYTGPGESKLTTQMKDTKEPVIVLHWNYPTTIFQGQTIVPVLIKIDKNSVQIGRPGSP